MSHRREHDNFSVPMLHWKKSEQSMKEISHEPNIRYGKFDDDFEENPAMSALEVFKKVSNFSEMVSDIMVSQTNKYAAQEGHNFDTDSSEIKAFI